MVLAICNGIITSIILETAILINQMSFTKALKSGIKVLCYNCKLSNKEIKLNNQIGYEQ